MVKYCLNNDILLFERSETQVKGVHGHAPGILYYFLLQNVHMVDSGGCYLGKFPAFQVIGGVAYNPLEPLPPECLRQGQVLTMPEAHPYPFLI